MMSCKKFSIMMIISFIIMYSVMFLNVDEANHRYISPTRIYMALLIVSPMAVVMLLMMAKMYPNKKLNTGIILGGIVVFGLVLTGLRTQTPIGDVQYMKAMIPHHSSAIMISKHANLAYTKKASRRNYCFAGKRNSRNESHFGKNG